MNVLEEDWLMKMPLDFELKKYKLLAATKKLNLAVKLGFIYDSLNEVEYQLGLLYKVKNLKNETEDKIKVMKGINLDTMSVEYEYPLESMGVEDMYTMCDYAIEELEAVYRLVRAKWRLNSKKITITEIPVRLPTKNKGIIFLKGADNKITVYSYSKPLSFIGDWKDMKLKKLEVNISNEKAMIKYIEATRKKNDINRFWRCDHTISFNNIESNIIPILQHTIFNKLLLY
tara:strand:- start:646 stop:1335 length:690 start_codon:yes stop_codon:yes gene_type:complete